jgi:hypothetical protein
MEDDGYLPQLAKEFAQAVEAARKKITLLRISDFRGSITHRMIAFMSTH